MAEVAAVSLLLFAVRHEEGSFPCKEQWLLTQLPPCTLRSALPAAEQQTEIAHI